MRRRLRSLGSLAVLPVLVAGCAATTPQAPPRATAPEVIAPETRAPTTTHAPPEPAPTATAPATAPPSVALTTVARSAFAPLRAYPHGDVAIVIAGSFVAMVKGRVIRQDAAHLAGLPDLINWDASASLTLPPTVPIGALEPPKGAVLSVHAGNRHGPGTSVAWDGTRWSDTVPPDDRRITRLQAPADASVTRRTFASGELAVAVASAGRVTVHTFPRGASTPESRPVPLAEPEFTTADLVGRTPAELYLCTFLGEVAALGAGGWSALPLPASGDATGGEKPLSCAATDDGALWVVTSGRTNRLLRFQRHASDPRGASGTWASVTLPEGESPDAVASGGKRLFVATTSSSGGFALLSDAPVDAASDVAAGSSPMDASGITGFDRMTVETASVSRDPAGPGTSACTSPVLFLGNEATPALLRIVASRPAVARLPLARVTRSAPGKAVLSPTSAFTRYERGTGVRSGVVALPASFAEGKAALDALGAELPEALLLCGKPAIEKRL